MTAEVLGILVKLRLLLPTDKLSRDKVVKLVIEEYKTLHPKRSNHTVCERTERHRRSKGLAGSETMDRLEKGTKTVFNLPFE